MAFSGAISGIVTNPIQKEALYDAGFRHQGHTDYLAHLSARHGYPVQEVMMLVAEDLRAIPITVHIPLKDVPAQLTREAILAQAREVDLGNDDTRNRKHRLCVFRVRGHDFHDDA